MHGAGCVSNGSVPLSHWEDIVMKIGIHSLWGLLQKSDRKHLIVVQEWQCHVGTQPLGSSDFLTLFFWRKRLVLLSSHQHGVVKKKQLYDVCNSYGRGWGWLNSALQYGYAYVPLSFRGNVATRTAITNQSLGGPWSILHVYLSQNILKIRWYSGDRKNIGPFSFDSVIRSIPVNFTHLAETAWSEIKEGTNPFLWLM